MPSAEKAWMMFVDGENFTIRAEERARRLNVSLKVFARFYEKSVCFWSKHHMHLRGDEWSSPAHLISRAERYYYYTSVQGDTVKVDEIRDLLKKHHFSPVVIKKIGDRSKGVDISLTKDLLVHAFQDNYDVAVLVTGDGDYVPVVEELKRMGKHVIVSFFGKEDALSPELWRSSDQYQNIDYVIKP